eukprot:1158518-Pelagomonas_calceolata.AAC.2
MGKGILEKRTGSSRATTSRHVTALRLPAIFKADCGLPGIFSCSGCISCLLLQGCIQPTNSTMNSLHSQSRIWPTLDFLVLRYRQLLPSGIGGH